MEELKRQRKQKRGPSHHKTPFHVSWEATRLGDPQNPARGAAEGRGGPRCRLRTWRPADGPSAAGPGQPLAPQLHPAPAVSGLLPPGLPAGGIPGPPRRLLRAPAPRACWCRATRVPAVAAAAPPSEAAAASRRRVAAVVPVVPVAVPEPRAAAATSTAPPPGLGVPQPSTRWENGVHFPTDGKVTVSFRPGVCGNKNSSVGQCQKM